MADAEAINWLHISDLHTGMTAQGWLWPNVKSAFLDDLRRIHDQTGSWDFVVFSGDVVQKGDADEFAKFDEIAAEIWQVFHELGSAPPLFVVPGNHDLVRPKDGPEALLLKRWFQEEAVRDGMWEPTSPYRELLEKAFAPFMKWSAQSVQASGLGEVTRGRLPGDISAVIEKNGMRIGLVGLNSTWLQLAEGEYEGALHTDVRQLLSVTGDDPEGWCRRNHVNLLVTHHPPTWMEDGSLGHWQSEINPPGRFDAHLFGHMHGARTDSVAVSGSLHRSSIQAASLFGLEKLKDGSLDRRHGYISASLAIREGSKVRTLWPRVLFQHASGKRRMIPDHSFELDNDTSVQEKFEWRRDDAGRSDPATPAPTALVRVAPIAPSGDAVLDRIRHTLLPAAPHAHVRLPEQEACIAALNQVRACWLKSEWGMGGDGFLWSAQRRRGFESSPTYLFDFQGYSSRRQFLDQVKEQHGYSFEQFCELISVKEASLVIFDEVPLHAGLDEPETLSREIESLASVVLEYCPSSCVVLRCRRKPSEHTFPVVEIRPLEEADTALYIRHSGLGGVELARPASALRIHRHTAGAPARIDAALKQLQVVRLSDLVGSNPDYSVSGLSPTPSPAALVRAVEDLRNSSDPISKRAYELLKTLSVFPYGEQLHAVRRFNNATPFFPPHATLLLDRGLITAASLTEIGGELETDNARLLLVPKSIRDYIRGTLKAGDLRSLDRKALDLYFGSKWKTGALSFGGTNKSEETLQSSHRIANAHALVLRMVREAVDEDDAEALSSALRVTSSYLAALSKGDYYRSVVSFCGDLFETLSGAGSEAQTELIRYQYAKSLRMIGEVRQAREMLVNLDLSILPKDTRQSALLSLALAHQSLGESDHAREAATETIRLGRYETPAIQAEAILVELNEDPGVQNEKLKVLEERAKKKKALTLASTIAISRANLPTTPKDDAAKIFEQVSLNARSSKDFYNEVRAIIQVANRSVMGGNQLPPRLKSRLIDAYHFLFNERLAGMFDGCHEALWSDFENSSDLENLLRLFRHSSLVWRLRDSSSKEQAYVERLAGKLAGSLVLNKPHLDRERAYFAARASAALLGKAS